MLKLTGKVKYLLRGGARLILVIFSTLSYIFLKRWILQLKLTRRAKKERDLSFKLLKKKYERGVKLREKNYKELVREFNREKKRKL